MRNVFILNGEVMLITDSDKGKMIRGIGLKVARFVPEEVGRMVLAYIAGVLPLEKMLQKTADAPGAPISLEPWMWKGGGRKGMDAVPDKGIKLDGLPSPSLTVSGLWGTSELTRKLTELTVLHIGRQAGCGRLQACCDRAG